MKFDGIDLTQYFRIVDIRKSILPPIQTIKKTVPGMDGVLITNTRLDSVYIEVDVRIKSSSKEELNETMRTLAKIFYPMGLKKLELPDEDGRYYLAQLDMMTDIRRIQTRGDTTLYFLCPEALAYGKTKTVSIVGSALFVNDGSSHATGTLTIEIVEDVDYIQATLLDTGEFVYLEHTFITGDILKIDLSEEMVYKNDYSIMKDCNLESDFFVIPPGESEITISSGVGTLIFTERWL